VSPKDGFVPSPKSKKKRIKGLRSKKTSVKKKGEDCQDMLPPRGTVWKHPIYGVAKGISKNFLFLDHTKIFSDSGDDQPGGKDTLTWGQKTTPGKETIDM
jgi:hypothetical protein